MKVIADKEGANAIKSLIDCALKAGGLANLECLKVLSCLEPFKPKTQVPEPDKPDKPNTPVLEKPKSRPKQGKKEKEEGVNHGNYIRPDIHCSATHKPNDA